MQSHVRSNLMLLSFVLAITSTALADFEPILLATNSYNCDMVIEKTAPPPAVLVTTASMEQGITNSGSSWFERGYLPEWPRTGIPEAGSILPSEFSPDHQYQMPGSYHEPNAFLIDTTRSNAVLSFRTPTNCAILSFLTSSGVARTVVGYEIRHVDGTTERGTFTSPNWYSDGNPAWAANGKANVTTFIHYDLNSYNPRLYSVDVPVSDSLTPIGSIGLSWVSGRGHAAILSASAASAPGAVFVPLGIAGYTDDIVVEADAVKPGFLETNTTATMETGTNNSGFTWYEKGYNPSAIETGLPAAGSIVTSESDPGYRFQLAPSYAAANAVLIDRSGNSSVIFFATPARFSALCFLTAASSGSPLIACVMRHADGTTETNSFSSMDWLSNSAPAVNAHGRVSVSTKLLTSQQVNGPRLFAVGLPVARPDSPIVRLALSRADTNAANSVIVFAVSGTPVGNTTPDRPVLSIIREAGGKISFRSTRAGRLQSCPVLGGPASSWRDEGPIVQAVALTPGPAEHARFYRVVAP